MQIEKEFGQIELGHPKPPEVSKPIDLDSTKSLWSFVAGFLEFGPQKMEKFK